jgi:hypothetical protein
MNSYQSLRTPRIYSPPTPLAKALDQADAWLESPTLQLLGESVDVTPAVGNRRILGAQVHDARIAALCQEHGVRG